MSQENQGKAVGLPESPENSGIRMDAQFDGAEHLGAVQGKEGYSYPEKKSVQLRVFSPEK